MRNTILCKDSTVVRRGTETLVGDQQDTGFQKTALGPAID